MNLKYVVPALFTVFALVAFAKLMPVGAQSNAPTIMLKQNEVVQVKSAKTTENTTQSNQANTVAMLTNNKINSHVLANRDSLPKLDSLDNTANSADAESLIKEKLSEKKNKKRLAINTESKHQKETLTPIEYVATRNNNNKNSQLEVKTTEHNKKPVENIAAIRNQHEAKSGFEIFTASLKQGQKTECSQVQISMNQCH